MPSDHLRDLMPPTAALRWAGTCARRRNERPPVSDRYVTLAELEGLGWTGDDVRRLDPRPIEYVALDGSPCWPRADLVPLLGDAADDDC